MKNKKMSDQNIRQAVCRFLSRWEARPQAIAPLLEDSLRHSEGECNQIQRALATNLAAGVIRWRTRLDCYINALLTRKKKLPPEVRNILRLALFELGFVADNTRPDYATVSEAVNLAKIMVPGREGLINGILRAFLRCQPERLLPADDDRPQNLAIRHSLPVWLVEKWQSDFGIEKARVLCLKANHFSGITFRVNCHKIDRDDFLKQFERENESALTLEKANFGRHAFHCQQAGPLLDSEWFKEGLISIQDEGAQLIVELMEPQPGEIILDACAAPGGKSAYLAELCDDKATIIAIDASSERLNKIGETCQRLNLQAITSATADLTRPLPADLPQVYDRILVDAPCSGLGVICRRPDLRWRKTLQESRNLAKIQLQILTNCSKYLKVGGRIIYATCTTCRNENQDVIADFLAQNKNFSLCSRTGIKSERLRKLINRGNFLETSFLENAQMDGFFAALMTKNS